MNDQTPKKPINFEAELAELEAITEAVDSDELGLDEAVAKFERGVELATRLKQHLSIVENRVEKIKARFESESAQATTSFDDDMLD